MINHAKASFSITPRGVFGVGVRLRNVITASVARRAAGGTKNYEELENLPSINGVVLTGNRNVDILENEIEVSIPLGGISQGTVYPKGTSFETILRSLLSPTLYPSFTNPSASLTGTGNKLLETGSTLAVTLTASFNRGSISPAYGTDGYRSGAATGYILNNTEEQSENTWNETVSSANKTFKVTVNYAEGEQPKDSSGGDYDSQLPAGAVETNTVSYDFVDAMWANIADITAVAKLSLVAKSTRQRDLTFPAQTVENPEIFDIPASWTVTHVQVKNDLNGQFEDASDQFTITEVIHEDAGGNTVNYNRYTFSVGFGTGTRTVRIKWS